ncbi:hypothetical protein SAMN05444397_10868 [Flavobacterium aquidurense]|uniref:P10 n=1 Tax=Flavobacterium frigidimaris TaxID=262320 RepID=A0ABX4BQZ3_FLAFR|nr:hypothetical protein [Flavobacterium frigidimaris]OXA78899.1 hypothetical protein B0A65_11965 [Flavobacterium frigidimaris]SDZ51610.1 hypothetical protein SAMN05444397_10868 [Flavobacterium aquidurense]
MNPINLLINYVIANSRANFYNVPGNQEVTNTALLTGMVSENPLMSYLIIDNKAKFEGEKGIVPVTTKASDEKDSFQGLPEKGSATTGKEEPAKTNEPTKEGSTVETAPVNVVTLEAVKAEISESTKAIKAEIAKIPESNKIELQKMISETLSPKIESLEIKTADLNDAILVLKKRVDEILKVTPAPTPDTVVPTKEAPTQKTSTKNEPK